MPWEAIGNITLVLTPKRGKDIIPSGLHFDDVHFFPKSLGMIVNKLFLYEHRVSSNPVVRLSTHTSVTQINSELVKSQIRSVMRESEEGGGGHYGEDLLSYEDCIRRDTEQKDHPNPSEDIAYIRYTVFLNQRITGGSYISVSGWSLFQHVFSDLMRFITLKNMGRDAFKEYRRMVAESGKNASCSWAIESENVFYGDQAGEDTIHSMMDRFDRFTTEKPAPEDLNVDNYLSVQLRKYQKRSLRFCMDVESEDKTLWIQVCQEPPLYYSPYFVQFSPHRGKNPTGGFLCDEMGLGKTVVSLALIMACPPPDNRYGNTLIVVPVSLVGQWVREAKKHIPELSHDEVYLHHGQSRITDRPTIASKKIVVTTYGIVSKEANFRGTVGNPRRGSLEDIHWHRVIFDESHVLKNHNTLQYRAAKALQSNHKWCVTGTPLTYDNQIRSQMGLVTNAFDKVVMNRRYGLVDPLLSILSHYMIRHRKTMVIDGSPIVELPGCETRDVPVEMSDQERLRYNEARNATAGRLPFMVGLTAFREIQNVRRLISNAVYQVGSGPSAISSCTEEERELAEQRIAEDHCAVCLDIYDAPTMLRCSHVFCFQCIHQVLANGHPRCPLCRQPFDRSTMRLVHAVSENNNAPAVQFKTKVQRTMELIRSRPQEKCLVFFHFQQSLDDFAGVLHRARVNFCQLNSSMAQRAREKALSRFENDPTIRVFLLSVRSSAVGINMTGASHIILFEPFMNKALEKQSIGRCWRLGQTRPVTVDRLYYANTLEEKILRDTTVRDSTNNWNVMNIRQLLQ